jgi:hypothetical protein
VHGSEVRVRQAFNDVRDVPCRSSASARRNHRNIQGDLRHARTSAQVATCVRSACMKEHVGQVASVLRGGSDTLQAATKTATLRCYRLDPSQLVM